jgi:glycosyltransferase involved in cell wall biosynthesis
LDILSHFSDDVDVKVVYFFPFTHLESHYKKAGIPVTYVKLNGKRAIIEGTKKLLKVIRNEKPDLIVSSLMRASFYSRFAGKISGVPVVGTFVGDSYGEVREAELKAQKKNFGYRFFRWLDKVTAQMPVYWISNGRAIAMSSAKALQIPSGKIKVVHRGRDLSAFPQWQSHNDRKNFHFIFIGRLIESKGLRELLIATSKIKEVHPHVKLDIIGEGAFKGTLDRLIEELRLTDTVIMHGRVTEGWKRLYEADCFVFPSWREGFSGALVEAMMAGIPIIASDIPMNLEAVDLNTALVYPVGDAEKLAQKMDEMISGYSGMVEMGKRARGLAGSKFEIRKIASEYESFLKSVVAKKVDKESLI